MARVGMLSDSYINGYEPSRVLLYAACIGMDVALVSAIFYQLEMLKTLSA
jgi:hypothetical protein